MFIGIKLEIGFSEHPLYRQLYGDHEILNYFRDLGFSAVETPVGPETGYEALREHVTRCCEAGLRISLHPYCEGTGCDPAYFSIEDGNLCWNYHQRLLSQAAEISQRQQSPTVINFHPAAGSSTIDRQILFDRSVSLLSWARQWCSRNAPDVQVVAELQFGPNTGEDKQRIGDTYDELLQIVTRSGIRACWDFGHAYFNAKRFDVPLYPTEVLLKQIGHVHCHDVCQGDHCPLIYDEVPWKDFVRLLIEKEFDETIIIEVPPSAFLAAGGLESVNDSLKSLMDWIEQCRQMTY
ncbi:MAG: sugar phosphate isomerase/epimerase [Sedimentisphaerales bacterium]|nr:sugar phosphate isomerase/epimerase [Sedimentisphaerales bacterium]